MTARPRSLVLAAHGSLAANNSNQPLHDLATAVMSCDRLRTRGPKFDVITPAFLNGQPEMDNVLDLLPPGDAVIVPVMTSEGYYLQKLPAKFAQNSTADDFRCFLSRVIGVHPAIPKLMSRRIAERFCEFQLRRHETTVVVVGHGTRRNPTSGESTLALTDSLRQLHPDLEFETAFLDQDPTADTVAAKLTRNNKLVLPFLISRGPHSTDDVPRAFGLPTGPDIEFPIAQKTGRGVCVCERPVGMYPEMAEICLELAEQALAIENPIRLSVLPVGEPAQ